MDDYEEIMNIMDEAGSLAEKKIRRELYSNKDTGDFTPHNVGYAYMLDQKSMYHGGGVRRYPKRLMSYVARVVQIFFHQQSVIRGRVRMVGWLEKCTHNFHDRVYIKAYNQMM